MRRNYLGLLAFLLSGTIFLVTSCNQPNPEVHADQIVDETNEDIPTELAVAPPIQGVDVPFKTYKIKPKEATTLETETGTTIEIPADAFVDENGNPIQEEVEIKFREFHDATDIIASGIPMHDPETGQYMETAGMFEINGQLANGQEVFVKGDKNINVNLASYNEKENFNFYELGKNNCRWKDLGTAEAKVNTRKKNRLKKLDNELKVNQKPRKRSEVENYVFDLDVNYQRFPELKPYRGVVWEYANKGPNPEKNEWIFTKDWDEVKLEKDAASGFFSLILQNGEEQFKTTVRPVLDGDDYEKALAQFKQNKTAQVTAIQKAQAQERARLEKQADLVRSFNVGGFGIYNWDIWKDRSRTRCQPEIMVENQAVETTLGTKGVSYFLVTGDRRSVVRYSNATLSRFSFNPHDKNILLALTNDGTIAMFTAQDFDNLDIQAIQADPKKALFNMATTTMQVESLDDLDSVIDRALVG